MAEEGGTKEIKFSFVVDQASAQSVMRTLKDLTDQAEKFAKALQGAAGAMGGAGGGSFFGGGNVGKPSGPQSTIVKNSGKGGASGSSAITNVVMENAKAFKGMAVMSGDALKSMTDILKKSVDDQKRSIGELDKTIEALGSKYQALKKKQEDAMKSGSAADQAFSTRMMKETGDSLAQAQGNRLKAQGDLKDMSGMLPQPKMGFGQQVGQAYAQGGIAGVGQMQIAGLGGSSTSLAGLAGSIATMVAAGAKAAYNEVREGEGGMDLRANARRGKLLNSRVDALRGGDISQLMVREDIEKDKDVSAYYKQQTDAAAVAEKYAKGGMEGLGKLPIIREALGLIGKDQGEGTILESMTTAEIQSKLLENLQNVEAKQADNANTHERLQDYSYYQNTLGSRVNARRVMGLSLRGKDNRAGSQGTYANLAEWSARNMVSDQQTVANYGSLRNQGGSKFAGQLAQYETLSQAGGYSGFGNMAAQANRGAGSAKDAMALARGALGGGIQAGAGMQLGSQIFGYNPLGTTSGEGLLKAVQSGVDWKSLNEGQQFNKVQALGGAINAQNAVMSGTLDNATLGASTLNAKKILGQDATNPNRASTRAVDYLAKGMDIKQMADIGFNNAKYTDQMQVYGIGRSDVRKMYASKMASLYKPELTDEATSPSVKKFIEGLESGKSSQFMLSAKEKDGGLSAKEKQQLRVATSNRMNLGGEEAAAFVDIAAGLGLGTKGQKLKQGDALGAKLIGPEAASAEQKAEDVRKRETNLQTEDAQGGLSAKIKNANEAAQAQKNFATNLGGEVQDVSDKLGKLALAIEKATARIEGKIGGPTKATAPAKK